MTWGNNGVTCPHPPSVFRIEDSANRTCRQDDVMWISVCDINKDGPFQGKSVSDYCQA